MKKQRKEDRPIIPMRCAVCEQCYRYADQRTTNCVFGGPFTGYRNTENGY